MRNWLWQKYSWVSHLLFCIKNLCLSPVKGTLYTLAGNNEKANYWFHETVEAFWWTRIHLTYKSTRIK
jgi:hypothetical protein